MPAPSQARAKTRRRQLFRRRTCPLDEVKSTASAGRRTARERRAGTSDGGTDTSRVRCVFGVVQTMLDPTTETLARIMSRRRLSSKSPTLRGRTRRGSPGGGPIRGSAAPVGSGRDRGGLRADPMTASGQLSWPLPGSSMAASGQFPVSAVTLRELMCLGSLVRPADGTSSWVSGVKSWHAAGFVRCRPVRSVCGGVARCAGFLRLSGRHDDKRR